MGYYYEEWFYTDNFNQGDGKKIIKTILSIL